MFSKDRAVEVSNMQPTGEGESDPQREVERLRIELSKRDSIIGELKLQLAAQSVRPCLILRNSVTAFTSSPKEADDI